MFAGFSGHICLVLLFLIGLWLQKGYFYFKNVNENPASVLLHN